MENKTGPISLILLVISVVLVFQESPFWSISILTFSSLILLPMIKKMWEVSGWISNQFNNLSNGEKYELNFKLDLK